MAIPTGGLNQVSAQQKPPVQAGNKFDASAAQAENIEEITKAKPTGLKESIVDDLGDQREAMNAALLRMRSSLDDRKNRMFDPVLMQTAAGFLKPTKTGSFGESLGYAAENAGVASEREMLHQRENQKLEMELLGKEQELRQQLGGDQLISALMGGPKTSSAPAPAGGAVTTPDGQLRVAGTASPVDVATLKTPDQVLNAARQGRIPITDEVLLLAGRVAPKMLASLQEIRRSQVDEEKNRIENAKLGISRDELDFKIRTEKRKVVPQGLRTEREMSAAQHDKYEKALEQFRKDRDYDKLGDFYESMGWLEQEQVGTSRPAPKSAVGTSTTGGAQTEGRVETTGGTLPASGTSSAVGTSSGIGTSSASDTPSPRGRAKSLAELEYEKARKQSDINVEEARRRADIEVDRDEKSETRKIRAQASEAAGNMVLERGRNATNMEALATDVLSLTDSNARAFNLMQDATVRDALLRAIEQGASVTAGPMTIALNLPTRVALQGNKEYQLTKQDIEALQVFQQKQSAITAEMRKMARTPGEGATDKAEGQLYAAIGILPTDSSKVLALKSEAMIQRARYDDRHAQLWSQFQEDNPNKSYTYFRQNSQDFKQLQVNYVRALNDMREKNADTLRSSPKVPAPPAPPAPAAPPAPPAPPPAPPAPAAPAAPAAPPAPPAPAPPSPAVRFQKTKPTHSA